MRLHMNRKANVQLPLSVFNPKVQMYRTDKFKKQKNAGIHFYTILSEQRASELRAYGARGF